MEFVDRLFIEYPIPKEVSIWGSRPGVESVANIYDLIETSVSEVASDILVTCYMETSGMITYMPEGTVSVKSAKLSAIYPFQGNRLVKCTFDKGSRRLYLRYYPAIITYERLMTVEDVSNLVGDRLIYFKSYVLYRMADKEINLLKAANMTIDNGQFDLSTLENFRDKKLEYYTTKKDEIMLYNSVY